MSTKITLDYEIHERIRNINRKGKKKIKAKAEPFHAYLDCMDRDKDNVGTVYLEMTGDVDFSASPGMVTVAIPPRVWKRLQKIGPIPVKRGKVQRFDLPVPPRIED